MTAISASQVKELRERTGLGMMECKRALQEANGDIEKAIDELRKSSGMKAAKKAGRIAAEGVIVTRLAEDGSYGVMAEINSETDFVARDENFLNFSRQVVDRLFSAKTVDVDALMGSELGAVREALVQKIGENISVRRAELKQADSAIVGSYVHGNNKIGVLVVLKNGSSALARDIAMHVAASNPLVVRSTDVSADVIAKEREIYSAQAAESGKPAEIVEKMIDGRIRKFLAEVSLVEQPFVKDPDVKVGDLVKKAGAEILSFTRYEVGEGIVKEQVDFAAEVAAQAGLS
ncbi:MAG: elongation factor Ts [Pseudomonadales bacterium]|jgi:elongation factor Ts|nr:elongation factor Ts [Pseudomonadales bacterium]MCP5333983.1 elongation factor Ts [Pseudomonadales bacterium]HMU90081.1 translation elongation factor Ts [Pseudomonadales bacterium]HMW14075.1 translation elongation factor Ts [Pseudomonadales bacterium]HMW82137.1 translation elongation factor Ts [Pseudomonadales bacterium]